MNRREMIALLGTLMVPGAIAAGSNAGLSDDPREPLGFDNGWQILTRQWTDKWLVVQWGRSDLNGRAAFPLQMNPLSVMAGVGEGECIPITHINSLGARLKSGEYWVAIGEIIE